MKLIKVGCIVFLLHSAVTQFAYSKDIQFTELQSHKLSNGPLLFLSTRKNDQSEYLQVVDPNTNAHPMRVLSTPESVQVYQRTTQNKFTLLYHGYHPSTATWLSAYLIDISAATIKRLIVDTCVDELTTETDQPWDAQTIFLRKTPKTRGMGCCGDSVELHCDFGAWQIYSINSEYNAKPHLLTDSWLTHLLEININGIWAITDTPFSIIYIAKDGKSQRKIFNLEENIMPQLTTSRFSPSGRYLALGVVEKQMVHKELRLLVIDLQTLRKKYDLQRIPAWVSPFSSFTPVLEFAWLNDDVIRFSESNVGSDLWWNIKSHFSKYIDDWSGCREGYFQWVDVDINTGKRIRAERYTSDLEIRHLNPADTNPLRGSKRYKKGQFFVIEYGYGGDETKVYFAGETSPVVVGNNISEFTVSPDGRWAALVLESNKEHTTLLLDGIRRIKCVLLKEWSYGLQWI